MLDLVVQQYFFPLGASLSPAKQNVHTNPCHLVTRLVGLQSPYFRKLYLWPPRKEESIGHSFLVCLSRIGGGSKTVLSMQKEHVSHVS